MSFAGLKIFNHSIPRLRCHSPAVAVGRVDVAAELDEVLDDVEVSGADGVVQRRDALVIRLRRVRHLQAADVIWYFQVIYIIQHF